jgi:ApaG protein
MAKVPRREKKDIRVKLVSLVHSNETNDFPEARPYAFAYRIRIINESSEHVVLNARKWILAYEDGEQEIYEGDKIIGKVVVLEPNESFEYSSFHLVERNCLVTGAYHGYSQTSESIWVRIPKFHLHIPQKIE